MYDRVVRTCCFPRCHAICYADDTLVLVGGDSWDETRVFANIVMADIVCSITSLGLRVAPQKTEAVFMNNGNRGVLTLAQILVDGERVPMGT